MIDPSGLFIDSGRNIISADSKNDRIQVNRIDIFEKKIIDYTTFRYFRRMVNIKRH
jgi:hypothetical protein